MTKPLVICLILAGCGRLQKETKPLSITVDSFIDRMTNQSMAYFGQQSMDSVNEYLAIAKDTVELLNDPRCTLYWDFAKIQQYIFLKNFDSAEIYIKDAVKLSAVKEVKDHDRFNLHMVQASFFQHQENYDSAFQLYLRNYFLAKKSLPNRIASASHDLAELAMSYGDTANVGKYAFEAWTHRNKEPELTPHIANLIVFYYDRHDALDSALHFVNSFTGDSTLSSRPDWQAEHFQNIGVLLAQKGKIKEGADYLFKAKEIYDKIGMNSDVLYTNLSEVLGLLKQFDKAKDYADSSIAFAKSKDDLGLIKDAWETKAAILKQQGNYENAYAALDSANWYFAREMDSSFRQKAREIETKYQVKEQNAEIKDLAFENDTNRKVASQQRLIIGGMIVITILSIVLGVLITRRSRMKMRIKEEELRQQLLRSQMNPHFIFNVLSVLQRYLKTDKQDKLIKYLNRFSKLLRINLDNSSKGFVPLQDELTALENYLELQQLLHEDKFVFAIDNFCSTEPIFIPPMLLQPFVENSILKGFSDLNQGGVINVIIEKVNNTLHCIIEDNGKGLAGRPAALAKRSSTAITADRLSILSHQMRRKATVSVIDKAQNNEGIGVRVDLIIPV